MKALKPIVLFFLVLAACMNGNAQQLTRISAFQLNGGFIHTTDRWDKHLGDLSSFYNVASLGGFTKPHVAGGSGAAIELNYIHNLNNTVTWKAGLVYQQIFLSQFDDNYRNVASLNFSHAGLQAAAVFVVNLNSSTKFLIQPGLTAKMVFFDDATLASSVDTLSDFFGIQITSTSNLTMEATDFNLAAVTRLELITTLNDKWAVSTAIDGQFALIKNFRFSAENTISNPFFPISTSVNSADFGMPQLQFSVGVVRTFSHSKAVKSVGTP